MCEEEERSLLSCMQGRRQKRMHHPPSSPEGGVLDRRVILIVEDDPTLGTFLVQFFQEVTPHFLLHARDTHEALAIVRSLLPDLLVVDDWLPHMNGLELSDRLEGDRDLHALPTLFMSTTHTLGAVEERCLPFLTKPFDLDTLLQTVEDVLPRDFL